MEESFLYKKINKKQIQCLTCSHYCFIKNNDIGLCGVRKNKNGKLYSLNYGKVCALNIDPVEKKPLFHFLPGTQTLSLASTGCNFSCSNCLNWKISQSANISSLKKIESEKIVDIALRKNIPSISYTYTEPTVFLEYSLDIMKLAKKSGLKNIWVTNGFQSKETLNLILPYLDAVNVDLKSLSKEFYENQCNGRLDPVLENLKKFKKNVWTEVTSLVIPRLNDSEKSIKEIADFIKNKLGKETPWHVSRFSSEISWKLQRSFSTPIEVIKKACQIGIKSGLEYVYAGNIDNEESTFCPKCQKTIIERKNYNIRRFDKKGFCFNCNNKIPIYD